MTCVKPFFLKLEDGNIVEMPCGQCVACKIQYSREWAMRLIHELDFHDKATFLTLTYNKEHLPEDGSLNKVVLQKFWKRLRKSLGKRRIKYFACGEYGDENGRPHYHAIVFGLGLDFEDQKLVKDAWPFGFVKAGTVTYDSCRYVCDYVLKKYNGVKKDEVYGDRQGPFKTGSQGLGLRFALANSDALREGQPLTIRGTKVKLPRYYKTKLGLPSGFGASGALESIKETVQHWKEHEKTEDLVIVYNKIRTAREAREREIHAKNNLRKRDKV